MGYFWLKIAGLSRSNNLENTVSQMASRYLTIAA